MILSISEFLQSMEAKYFKHREEWRKWLEAYFREKDEIWLIYPKKISDKPRIPYNDAVEEALCFGWIDSIYKKWDQESSVQRFTPRKKGSRYSQANKERLRWLRSQNMIHPDCMDEVDRILRQTFDFPNDIITTIKQNHTAWQFLQATSGSYQRIRIAYIESARKRPEEFEKRLKNLIKHCQDGKLVKGFGGIEKYY